MRRSLVRQAVLVGCLLLAVGLLPDVAACPQDIDGDGICDAEDNCPQVVNPAQTDTDLDGIGDACDPCPADPTNQCDCPDADEDLVCDPDDNGTPCGALATCRAFEPAGYCDDGQ